MRFHTIGLNFAGYVKSARKADGKVVMELTPKILNRLLGFACLKNRLLLGTILSNQSPYLLYLRGWADMARVDDIEDIRQKTLPKIVA